MTDKPNIEPFERAIQRLKESHAEFLAESHRTTIRDGFIHRFEFVYEMAPKILRRYIEYALESPSQIIDQMTFQELIRTANEQGLLLGEWTDWRGYRDMRARTSHSYDEDTSLDVIERIPKFIEEVVYLQRTLRKRLG